MAQKVQKKTVAAPKTFAIALTTEEAGELNTLLGEIPAKFANPLFNFFNAVSEKRRQEQAAAAPPPQPEV